MTIFNCYLDIKKYLNSRYMSSKVLQILNRKINDTNQKLNDNFKLYEKHIMNVELKDKNVYLIYDDYSKVNLGKFPLVKLLRHLPNYSSLFETVLITVNDYLVFKFLNKQINYKKLITLIDKIVNFKEFVKYKKIKPKNVDDIYRLRGYVSSKMDSLGI